MDVLRELGPAFLGSRLKRLSERLQSGAARIAAEAGLQAQPSHMSILAALEGAPLTIGQLVQAIGISQPGITRSVGQLVELGLLKSRQGADQRQRTISLTTEGKRVLARAERHVWPKAEAGVRALLGEDVDKFMEMIGKMEAALAVAPLDAWSERAGRPVLAMRRGDAVPTGMSHRVERYTGGRDGDVAAMVLAIQNGEYGLGLTIDEQPDLADIPRAYADGGFWIAIGADDAVIGSIGLLRYGARQGVLKKFFVAAPYRGPSGPASALYGRLIRSAREQGIEEIFLDTPSAATRSHGFYRRAGFEVIDRGGLPEGYRFPDRDSLIFRLKM